MEDEVLAVIRPSGFRRGFGVVMLTVVAAVLIYAGATSQAAALWRAVLVLAGIAAFYMAVRTGRATASCIELTAAGLRDGDGTWLIRMEQIEALDRGAFALKPSNGFMIHARTRMPGAWRPGLWWRIGRRIGVGGLTAAAETKLVSDKLALMLAEREGQLDDQAS